MSLVYDELRRLAGAYMQSERPDHTLQPAALVNEAYLRLVDAEIPWQNRARFFAVAARLMRRILVDHAKSHRRAKRGGGRLIMTLDESLPASQEPDKDIIALDDALRRLAAFDERKSRIIELHFFGGMTYDEMAEALGISQATGHRPYQFKSYLPQEMERIICEHEPKKPSTAITDELQRAGKNKDEETQKITAETLSRRRASTIEKLRKQLSGDLDNIALMALRKEQERRYSSVEQFSDDIRRHLGGLPVMARHDALGYRANKFIRRHAVGATSIHRF